MARALRTKWIAARSDPCRWHMPMPVFDIDDVAGQIDTALAPRIALASGVEVRRARRDAVPRRCRQRRTGGRQGRAPRRPSRSTWRRRRRSPTAQAGNLAGAVGIDCVTMRSTYDRDKVQRRCRGAARGPRPDALYGFTRLGHFELTRARRGATLAGQLEALEKRGDG